MERCSKPATKSLVTGWLRGCSILDCGNPHYIGIWPRTPYNNQPMGVQVIIHLGNGIIMRSMTLVITLINQDLD